MTKKEEEETQFMVKQASNSIVAVTACPTGIAHTYMSADALKAKAAEMGVLLKLKQMDPAVLKTFYTTDEIKNSCSRHCCCRYHQVDMDRFNGKACH